VLLWLGQRLCPSDSLTHDEHVGIVGPLVGIGPLQIGHVLDDPVVKQDPVAAHQIARQRGNLSRLGDVAQLHHTWAVTVRQSSLRPGHHRCTGWSDRSGPAAAAFRRAA
jgi:hypothetical protein